MNDHTPTSITDATTIGVPVTTRTGRSGDRDSLGFEMRRDVLLRQFGGRWIEMAPPGARITIAPSGPRGAFRPVCRRALGSRLRDAAAVHADLRALAVDVGELLRWPGVPAMFAVHDQDGNGLEIVEAT